MAVVLVVFNCEGLDWYSDTQYNLPSFSHLYPYFSAACAPRLETPVISYDTSATNVLTYLTNPKGIFGFLCRVTNSTRGDVLILVKDRDHSDDQLSYLCLVEYENISPGTCTIELQIIGLCASYRAKKNPFSGKRAKNIAKRYVVHPF